MKLGKIIVATILIVVAILGGMGAYLLQPSGQLRDFDAWQAKPDKPAKSLNIRFFGVSTLLFDDGQEQILIDGFFSRPSLWQVLSSKVSSNAALLQNIIQEEQLHRTRAILVTHSHYDHALDLPELAALLPHTQIIGSNSTLNIARSHPGVKASQLRRAVSGQPLQSGQFKVTPLASAHTPPTPVNDDLGEEITAPLKLPAKFSDFKEGGSFDYLIEHDGQQILVKASTGFIPGQLKNVQADILFLGIAQLSRQSEDYQKSYLQQTLATVKPKIVIPIHWDDFFQPLSQPLQFLPRFADNVPESMRILIKAAEAQQIQVVLLSNTGPYSLLKSASSQVL
ncbi:MBL fold metallo-hydrolase [Acinetobacter sp. ASP199]|uniref:MBL fold metallo-hydrolase n=1 Tax=unclassified Acinetobacter TaxID=196816 RepID=UPI001F601886|nr:MBL fold metallo-hydrolase [Acinetobacter sp. ASP199]UNT59118.1 MBL fold metallo-hydrolase [Acinetobacter sp. ASP199]